MLAEAKQSHVKSHVKSPTQLLFCKLVHHQLHLMSHQACYLFLQVVEASAAAGEFVSRALSNLSEPETRVDSLQDFVVAIPTMNAIHGQDSWQAVHVSEKFADHSAWDVHVIVDMLCSFFAVSGAVSLPDLAEYEWRLDKVSIILIVICHRYSSSLY